MNKSSNRWFSIILFAAVTLALTLNAPFAEAQKGKKQRPVPQVQEELKRAQEAAARAEERARKAEEEAAKAKEEADRLRTKAEQLQREVGSLQDQTRKLEQSLNDVLRQIGALQDKDKRTQAEVAQVDKKVDAAQAEARKGLDELRQRTEGIVTTESKFPAKVYGTLLFNAFYNNKGTDNNDVPQFGLPRSEGRLLNEKNFGATARQTLLGLRYDGPRVGNANLSGAFEFDLFGGRPDFPNGAHFSLFRLRLAYGRLDWENTSIEIGQDYSVFAPLNPINSIAAVAIPELSAAGNLWARLPQFRFERHEPLTDTAKLNFQFAVLDPNAGTQRGFTARDTLGPAPIGQAGERGKIPAFETRLGFSPQIKDKTASIGVSARYHRLDALRNTVDGYGVAGDIFLPIDKVTLSGEIFRGRALGIFSGGVTKTFNLFPDGSVRGINSTGGWLQVSIEPTEKMNFNAAWGKEFPESRDLLTGDIQKNQIVFLNTQYKLSRNLIMQIEWKRILTNYFRQAFNNQAVDVSNISFAYTF